ncbi:putative bifunctional diguanylate cyclase/phosphodiesterase [Dactylosporangium sp. CS-033363]|uniref:putative bifunctional diguanylate cyclase/phosphodiesterase n=1 Tax=Dactylosporangium sp. CS-033363 TaxID=3239935 RepID=UPI003D8EFA0E
MATWRPTRLLVAAAVVALLAEVWFGVGLLHPTPAVVSWVAVPFVVGLAVRACLKAAGAGGMAAGAARFWRHVALGMALIGLGAVSNGVDMLRGIARPGHVGALTSGIYVAGLAVLLWALLRIPGTRRSRGEWLRFGLDSATVLVTVLTFCWHFLLSDWRTWSGDNASGARSILALLACGAVVVFAFVKIAFTGTGPLDRRALYLLASAGAVGALGGALAPLLASRPYLNGTPVILPVTCLVLCVAADRQRRAARVAPLVPARRERPGFVSYAAVFATCVLLLADAAMRGADILGVAVGTVILVLLVAARQVTALRDNAGLVRSLAWQAGHDSLTDLANRRLLTQHIAGVLARGRRVAVALVDIDDFKAINDDLGHATGDALLRAVAVRLDELMGDQPVEVRLVARLGGDEYALVFPAFDEPSALLFLGAVAAELRRPLDAAGHALVVEASVGVAVGDHDVGAEELIRRADVGMYAAKVQGKGRQVAYDQAMDQRGAEQARIAAELRVALDTGQLRVFYQPIVRLGDGTPVGVEALVRWQHPERGMIRPDLFIPAAERTGLIVPVGQWVLAEACRQAARWRRELGPDALRYVSVNVSPRQLRESGFAGRVRDELRAAGLPPGCLMVEVTETAVFDGGSALDELHEVKRLGVQVALDDFGTGHSSLGLLRTCPVDVLKVDKSFVDNVTEAGARSVIAEALIGIADGLRLRAVAEGVETEEQAAALRDLGYQFAQGYLYGRPAPADELTTLGQASAGRVAARG